MTAQVVNIELDPGADTHIQFDWTDPSTNLPIDLTGYTAHMQVRLTQYDPIVKLDFTTTNGKITLGGAAGTIIISFSKADTDDGDWFRATYDLYIVNAGGDGTSTAVARGAVVLLQQTSL